MAGQPRCNHALRRLRAAVPLPPRVTALRTPLREQRLTGYSTRILDVDVLGDAWRLRVLGDRQQFSDPDGHAERAGISSAQWPLFGQLWPAGERLAEAMHGHDVGGKRVLELGCGIGLASLVLQRRGADVVASDIHPLAEPFLAYNAALNGLPAVHFRHVDWARHLATLGRFDVIIASDVIYEAEQVERVADAIGGYANDGAEVVVTDPGRGGASRLARALGARGFHDRRGSGTPARTGSRDRTLHFERPAAA